MGIPDVKVALIFFTILIAFAGWVVIESLIWLFSHVGISWVVS